MRESFFARRILCVLACAVICVGAAVFPATAQAQQCTFTASPAVVTAAHSGGAYTVNFTASGSACNWVVSSAEDWITVPAAHRGTGSGAITVTVKPNTGGAARQGRIDLNRQYIWVNQPQRPSCTYSLTSASRTVAPDSGRTSFSVTASDPACVWTVSDVAPWLHIETTQGQGQSRTGSGTVHVGFYTNPSPGVRSGTLTIAGLRATVKQEACTCSVSPSSINRTAHHGGTAFSITTNHKDCPWTVEETAGWITIPSGSRSGKGNATVHVQYASNPSASARSAVIKVKNASVNVTQQGLNCTYSLTSASRTVAPDSGRTSFSVTASDPACVWTVSDVAPWLHVETTQGQGQSRTGSGTVHIGFYTNPSPGVRTGTLTIAGLRATVKQEACTCSVSHSSINLTAHHGGTAFSITTNHKDCPWTVEETAGWITIPSGSRSGKGNATVHVQYASNPSASARSAVIKVKNASVNVTQQGQASPQSGQSTTGTDPASAQLSAVSPSGTRGRAGKPAPAECSCTLSKTGQNMGPGDTRGSFSVKTDGGCDWRAAADSPWIAVTSGSSGKGKGMVKFAVKENPDASPRTGRIVVAGQAFSINQKGQKAGKKERGHR